MNLAIDVGNTHVKLGWFDAGRLVAHDLVGGDQVIAAIHRFPLDQIEKSILAQTGVLSGEQFDWIAHHLSGFVHLDHRTALPFRNLYATPETLGYDRIAAVAGAMVQFPETDVLAIDAGTAITFDFLTSDGRYMGGSISPGMAIRFRALNMFTRKLPLVEYAEEFPDLGLSTRDAILSGVIGGLCHEIDGYIQSLKTQYPGLVTLFTGGDGPALANRLKNPIFASPFLVLMGLNHILNHQVSSNALS